MMFYGIVFTIMAILGVICSMCLLSENKTHSAGTAILIALVSGGIAMNHFEVRGELKSAHKQVFVVKQDNKQLANLNASLERKFDKQVDELAEAQASLKEARATLVDARVNLMDAQDKLSAARNDIRMLKADLKVAQEATQVDRDRMLLLEQENTELRTTLTDIQEAVR